MAFADIEWDIIWEPSLPIGATPPFTPANQQVLLWGHPDVLWVGEFEPEEPVSGRASSAEFYGNIGTVLFGTRDHVGASWLDTPDTWLDSPGTWLDLRPVYRASVVNEPEFTRELSEFFYGFIEVAEASITLFGADITALRSAQGQPSESWRNDREQGVEIHEFSGLVDATMLNGDNTTTTKLINQDLSLLETLIPKRLTSTSMFGATCPEPDVPIPAIIGTIPNLKLRYVVDDVPAARFAYLVGEGSCHVTAVYRDRDGGLPPQLLTPGEYMVSSTAYPGVTVVITRVRQEAASGGFHTLYADVSALSTLTRNPAHAFAAVMGDETWGLGLPVDEAWIAAEAAILPPQLVLDGAIGGDGQQRPARDVLREILMVRGGRPTFDATRGWRVSFDSVAPTGAVMELQDGSGPGARTLLSPGRRDQKPLREKVKSFRLKYAIDYSAEGNATKFIYQSMVRTISTLGKDTTLEHTLIRDRDCADRVTYYYAHRLRGAEDLVTGAKVHEDGRIVQAGDIVTQAVCTPLGFNLAVDRLVVGATKAIGEQTINHVAFDLAQYTHVPGVLPPLQVRNTDTTEPAQVVSLSIVPPGGTYQATDRTTKAYVDLLVVVPISPTHDRTILEYRRVGTTTFGNAQSKPGAGNIAYRVDGLATGTPYDYRATTQNRLGQSVEVLLLNQTTTSDTTAPTDLGTPTIQNKHLKTFTAVWMGSSSVDWETCNWDLRTSSNGGGSIIKNGVIGGRATTFTLNAGEVAYGTACHFRVQPIDASGNVGNFTSSVSITFVQLAPPDYGAGSVPSTARDAVFVISIGYAGTPAMSATIGDITHNNGRTILASTESGNDTVSASIVSQGINTIRVMALNFGASPANGTFVVRYY